jgi:hypothetical protein
MAIWASVWRKSSAGPNSNLGPLGLWSAYRMFLVVQADRLRNIARGEQLEARDKVIDELLSEGNKGKWEKLFEAEQRLAYLFDDGEVKSEFARRVVEGKHLGIPSVDALNDLFCNASDEGTRQATLIALLDDVHFRYVKRDLDRRTRDRAALSMNNWGVVLASLTVGLLAYLIWDQRWEVIKGVTIFLCIWFGAIGAFLSRLIKFQSQFAQLDYEDIKREFVWSSVAVRMLVGVFGAIVVYFLISGGFLDGELFPDVPLELAPPEKSSKVAPGGLLFSQDLAKLLIWATLAGFSERLVPDSFGRLERSTTTGLPMPSGPKA